MHTKHPWEALRGFDPYFFRVDQSRQVVYPDAMAMTRRPDIESRMMTNRFGRPLYWVDEIDSTNRVLREWAEAGASEGTVLVAEYQAAGRGRRGRTWEAPPGTGLLLSLLLRPARDVQLIPFVTACALAEAIEVVTDLDVRLKWPNDVRVGGKKVAGILAEAYSFDTETVVVVGTGVNVRVPADVVARFPSATSLSLETQRPVERVPLLIRFLEMWEATYDLLQTGEWALDAWKTRSDMLGSKIDVVDGDARWVATAVDVADDGALLVQDNAGDVVRLYAGDVTIRYGE